MISRAYAGQVIDLRQSRRLENENRSKRIETFLALAKESHLIYAFIFGFLVLDVLAYSLLIQANR
jgi:IS4 transposase